MTEITKNTRPEELIAAVRKIDDRLDLAWPPDIASDAENLATIDIINHPLTFTKVYSFELNKWFDEGSRLLNQHQKNMLNDFIDQIETVRNSNHELIIPMNESNPFKDYTNHLAVTLENKNKAYGDSFSRSVDKFGIIAAVVRLEDKFNRLENLTANGGKEKVKDESLADTALDISGYGLLLYKYLKERERTSK